MYTCRDSLEGGAGVKQIPIEMKADIHLQTLRKTLSNLHEQNHMFACLLFEN
ncbi:hypothetical protein DPMN_019298 [Dreissena polymorpha]|uniref:Uncharacterized protein n=1 Tax=Dreissena polymorpha TaxID=45954 RepID=A0A9D4S962_DREPO|nr:hypothetical protein DPMN_019298 [Dreissena polymorpha]